MANKYKGPFGDFRILVKLKAFLIYICAGLYLGVLYKAICLLLIQLISDSLLENKI